MDVLTMEFPAQVRGAERAHVGVVGSGDLEVLFRPDRGESARVRVRTSLGGFESVWETTLARFFSRHPVAGRYELNDFGATPGVVTLRLLQVVQDSGA